MADSQTPLPWEGYGPERAHKHKRVGMIVDLRRCVGCHSCSVSCKTEHVVDLGDFRIRTHYAQRPEALTMAFIPMLCMHCEDAPCIKACPVDAMGRADDGRVLVDEKLCDGHKECMSACPYGAIFFNEERGKAEKCDLCEHRTSVGLDPACVEACPTEVLRFGDLDDEDGPLALYAKQVTPLAFKAEEETKPRVTYVGLEKWMETKAKGVQRSDGEDGIVYE